MDEEYRRYLILYSTQILAEIVLAEWNFTQPSRMAILTAKEFIKRNGYGKPIPSFAEFYRNILAKFDKIRRKRK